MYCSTPGFPVLHYLPDFARTHVLWVNDLLTPQTPQVYGIPCLYVPDVPRLVSDCLKISITVLALSRLILCGQKHIMCQSFPPSSSVFPVLCPQFTSVPQSCPALCDPMYCSTPGFPVHHQLLELAQTHVHWVGDAIQLSHPLSSPSCAFNLRSITWLSLH